MATVELTDEQQAAVDTFGTACVAFAQGLQGLEEAGMDIGSALRAIPNPDGEGSLYDLVPASLKMML